MEVRARWLEAPGGAAVIGCVAPPGREVTQTGLHALLTPSIVAIAATRPYLQSYHSPPIPRKIPQ